MRIFDISALGWLHTLACIVALPAGLWLLMAAKGTPRHQRIGRWYLISMVIGSVTALGLYAPIAGIEPGFNRFHWMAVMTLIALGFAYIGARRQAKAPWAYVHPAGMLTSYYMLIGALINESFARADVLQAYAGGRVLGLTQAANMALFFALLIVVLTRIALKRARLNPRPPQPAGV